LNEPDVLKHLLEIEEAASKIVNDAEEEANRQVIENDKNCREAYSKNYALEAASMDSEYADKRARLEADYKSRLEEYRGSLSGGTDGTAGTGGTDAFAAMFGRFLGVE
jgi:F0F1-type ATP synthase membrane subunit b/b'